MSDNNIVPFGKYKGQPIEVLVNDHQYTDWLTAQPWFRERHENLYTVIINNFGEPSETPEHNQLQAKFLDNDFCVRCMELANPGSIECEKLVSCQFEYKNIDVLIKTKGQDDDDPDYYYYEIEVKPEIGDDYPAVLRQMRAIIIKRPPAHPSVHYNAVLLVDRFNATGATREQFVEIFRRASIDVVFLTDVENSRLHPTPPAL